MPGARASWGTLEAVRARTGDSRSGTRDWVWVLVMGLAVVWVAGSVVNVAWRIGVEDRSLLWLLEVPASAIVAWWLGGAAWRRTSWAARRGG
jgi:hypothetical protein